MSACFVLNRWISVPYDDVPIITFVLLNSCHFYELTTNALKKKRKTKKKNIRNLFKKKQKQTKRSEKKITNHHRNTKKNRANSNHSDDFISQFFFKWNILSHWIPFWYRVDFQLWLLNLKRRQNIEAFFFKKGKRLNGAQHSIFE